jgi:hypothetical protein
MRELVIGGARLAEDGGMLMQLGWLGLLFGFLLITKMGHFVVGCVIVLVGLHPAFANNHETHKLKVGADKAALELNGNIRTVLFGVGALIIAGSFVEAVAG